MNYPYFIHPAVMALRKGVDDPEEERRLRRIVAANVGDIAALRLILGIDPEEFASFYPDLSAPALTTDATISSFLSRFGREEAPLPQAAAEIRDSVATRRSDEEALETDSSATGIAGMAEASAPTGITEADNTPAPLPATEQNAYILIKKHDYQGALEIIKQLSLNIPEKSVYFADQIRFLKKLILNEARKSM